MNPQNIRINFIPGPQLARVALNRKLRNEQRGFGKAGKILWGACKFIDTKFQNFLQDEKSCDKKLGRILGDIDSEFKALPPSADNSWLHTGKYQPVFTGPFAPVPEKKKKDKVINIIIK